MNVTFLELDRYGTKILIEKDVDFVPRIGDTFSVDTTNFKVVSMEYYVIKNKIYVIGEACK